MWSGSKFKSYKSFGKFRQQFIRVPAYSKPQVLKAKIRQCPGLPVIRQLTRISTEAVTVSPRKVAVILSARGPKRFPGVPKERFVLFGAELGGGKRRICFSCLKMLKVRVGGHSIRSLLFTANSTPFEVRYPFHQNGRSNESLLVAIACPSSLLGPEHPESKSIIGTLKADWHRLEYR